MTRWRGIGLFGLLIIVAAAALFLIPKPTQAPGDLPVQDTQTGGSAATTTASTSYKDLVVVDSPASGATVTSPLTITGKARGTWYFEASFPVALTDWDGKIIAQGIAQAQGDWMTSDYVPFTATLTFEKPAPGDPAANRGTLILKKDNPSGLPEHEDSFELPILFR